MAKSYLDKDGLTYLWGKIKSYVSSVLPTKTSDLTNDSGFLVSQFANFGAKNLLPNRAGKVTTINGMKFTVNADGSVTLNGTASSTAIFNLISDTVADNRLYLPAGNYIINGESVNNNNFWIGAYKNADSGTWAISSKSSGGAFTVASGDYIFPRIRVGSGITFSNVTVYPQIRLASVSDSSYVSYGMSNAELTKHVIDILASIS